MITIVEPGGASPPQQLPALRGMFEARKRVFVDMLKWNVPVIDGRFEVDQFDDADATYLIVSDRDGRHAASARLLKTGRRHILDSLFPQLCELAIPRGPETLEITRFCLDPGRCAADRLEYRNLLVSALVAYALRSGVERYTGVAEMGWLSQILSFGWDCRPLGLPQMVDGKMLGALLINITPRTPSLIASGGIFREAPFEELGLLNAA